MIAASAIFSSIKKKTIPKIKIIENENKISNKDARMRELKNWLNLLN